MVHENLKLTIAGAPPAFCAGMDTGELGGDDAQARCSTPSALRL